MTLLHRDCSVDLRVDNPDAEWAVCVSICCAVADGHRRRNDDDDDDDGLLRDSSRMNVDRLLGEGGLDGTANARSHVSESPYTASRGGREKGRA